MARAYLLLETGEVCEGEGFGAEGVGIGELVFTTAMTGCTESLTDPSFRGQLVVFTFPQLGNCGIAREDMESGAAHPGAVVVGEYCRQPSNFRCELTVDDFLREQGVCGICGVDTRRLTQLIRGGGVLNAAVTREKPDAALLEAVRAFRVEGVVAAVATREIKKLPPPEDARFSVAMLDLGAKKSMAEALTRRGCAVTLYPPETPAEVILAGGHDGVMLSNGPGDPAENRAAIATTKKLMGALPCFGVCLGHQLMALAQGAETEKMRFGHRGENQPARDLKTGRVYITSQNHGYAVKAASLPGTGAELRFQNANDGSCEGLDFPALRSFSVQFHPEAHGGPTDTQGQFDRFISLMGGGELA